MDRGIDGNGISNAAVSVDGHGRVNESDNWNLEFESLIDDGGLALSVDDDDAIWWLSGTKAELLIARAELLGAVAVGEKATVAPERVGRGAIRANLLGHEFEDFVEERVGVDEHESSVMACEGSDEVAGTAHAN